MPSVFSRRRPDEIPKGSVYVGRPSRWGNPFSKGSKAKNIADFRKYAEKRHTDDPNWLKPLQGKHLVCWCSPDGCHADILIELANEPGEFVRDTYRYQRATQRYREIETGKWYQLLKEYQQLLRHPRS